MNKDHTPRYHPRGMARLVFASLPSLDGSIPSFASKGVFKGTTVRAPQHPALPAVPAEHHAGVQEAEEGEDEGAAAHHHHHTRGPGVKKVCCCFCCL